MKKQPTPEQALRATVALQAVAKVTGMDPERIRNRRRRNKEAEARYMVFITAERLGITREATAGYMEKDHATVCTGIKRGVELCRLYKEYREALVQAIQTAKDNLISITGTIEPALNQSGSVRHVRAKYDTIIAEVTREDQP